MVLQVIFDFGWSKYWKSFEAVYGSKSEDVTTFHFPGVGLSAAELLASRGVYGEIINSIFAKALKKLAQVKPSVQVLNTIN